MTSCIIKELQLRKDYLTDTIETIYFGGGTPSLLGNSDLDKILSSIYKEYIVSNNLEITLEANPDDLDYQYLKSINEIGINRLSIGIQSFNEEVLSFLNRAHSSKQAKESMENARKAGFENISIDLIYGIPNRNDSQWLKDVELVAKYQPEHISAYCLTIEPNTAFGNWVKKGKLIEPDEEQGAHQFELLIDKLNTSGYEQYEISNFCLSDFESRHNSSYWKQVPYLGVGPSAHSFNLKTRQFNVKNNIKYIKSLELGELNFELDNLTEEDKINEYILTSLRTKWGVDLNKYHLKDKIDIDYIDRIVSLKKAEIRNDILYLTKEGKLIADQISSDLFLA